VTDHDDEPDHAGNLADLMRRIEERHHQRGWRKTLMTAYVVFDHYRCRRTADILTRTMGKLGPATVVGNYGAQPMITDKALLDQGVDPRKALITLAHNVAFLDIEALLTCEDMENAAGKASNIRMLRELLQMPGIVGFAAVLEGYGIDLVSPELVEQARGGDVETMPGSREARLMVLVDAGDQMHRVRRIRGYDHTVELFVSMCGEPSNSLRKMMDLNMVRLPTTQEEADARYQKSSPHAEATFQSRKAHPAG
jgi:hypothetical protein